MNSEEIKALVEAEIDGEGSVGNSHGVDLRTCLVTPRKARCRNTFPQMNCGKPLDLWIVLEETPGSKDGYLIVYDDLKNLFGLADWSGDEPVFLGYHGGFWDTLKGM